MTKTIYICDKCKIDEINDNNKNPVGWVDVKLNINNEYCGDKHILVCKECAEKAGLLDEKGKALPVYSKGIAEQLIDLLSEIAQEAVQNG